MRIAICGVPRAGKTTYATELAGTLGIHAWHTDALMQADDWAGEADAAAAWLARPGPWVCEGVTVTLALIRGAPEPDVLIWLPEPREVLTRRQQRLSQDIRATWQDLRLDRAQAVTGSAAANALLADLWGHGTQEP